MSQTIIASIVLLVIVTLVLVALLLIVKSAITPKGTVKIDYPACSIPNDFIVGYGLDYNEYGRNLKEIYKIVE